MSPRAARPDNVRVDMILEILEAAMHFLASTPVLLMDRIAPPMLSIPSVVLFTVPVSPASYYATFI
jgi:hypothetical protein